MPIGPPHTPLESVLYKQHPLFIDLLKHLIVIDPDQRYSALEAMQHKTFSKFFNPADVVHERLPQDDFLWDNEMQDYTIEQLRAEVDNQIATFNEQLAFVNGQAVVV